MNIQQSKEKAQASDGAHRSKKDAVRQIKRKETELNQNIEQLDNIDDLAEAFTKKRNEKYAALKEKSQARPAATDHENEQATLNAKQERSLKRKHEKEQVEAAEEERLERKREKKERKKEAEKAYKEARDKRIRDVDEAI
jgi:hypothetical protein